MFSEPTSPPAGVALAETENLSDLVRQQNVT